MPKLSAPPKLPSRSSGKEPAGADDARTRQRFLHRQRARRWVAVRRLLAPFLLLALVAGGLWLVFFSSVLAVQQVQVRGVQVLSAARVEQAAAVPLGVPLATSDLGAVQARVEDLAPVASATVSRSWPDTIRIEVSERTAVAVVDWAGSWRGLDEQGVLFRDYPQRPERLPRIAVRASTPSDALAEAAQVVGAVPPGVASRLDYVQVGSVDDIALYLRDGVVVNWGSAEESTLKGKVLTVLMQQQRGSVYDVTAPGRPTVKP